MRGGGGPRGAVARQVGARAHSHIPFADLGERELVFAGDFEAVVPVVEDKRELAVGKPRWELWPAQAGIVPAQVCVCERESARARDREVCVREREGEKETERARQKGR